MSMQQSSQAQPFSQTGKYHQSPQQIQQNIPPLNIVGPTMNLTAQAAVLANQGQSQQKSGRYQGQGLNSRSGQPSHSHNTQKPHHIPSHSNVQAPVSQLHGSPERRQNRIQQQQQEYNENFVGLSPTKRSGRKDHHALDQTVNRTYHVGLQNPHFRVIKNWMQLNTHHLYVPANLLNRIQINNQPMTIRIDLENIGNMVLESPNPEVLKEEEEEQDERSQDSEGNYNPQKPKRSYDLQWKIILSASLYNAQYKKFFGRTYKSRLIDLKGDINESQYEFKGGISMYMKTLIDTSAEGVHYCVVEAELIHFDPVKNIIMSKEAMGFALFECFKLTAPTEVNQVQFYKGSAYFLYQYNIQDMELADYHLNYRVVRDPRIKDFGNLIPDSVLCGFGDIVPGIKDGIIPLDLDNVKTYPLFNLTISNINILMNEGFENWILGYARMVRDQKYPKEVRKPGEDISDVFIYQRKLKIVGHNTWTAVNQQGFEHEILLALHQRMPNDLVFHGVATLNQIFFSTYLIMGVSLEYVLKLPGKNNLTEDLVLNLAWLPHVLNDPDPAVQGHTQVQVDTLMILAPGKNYENKPLFDHLGMASGFNVQFRCLLTYPFQEDFLYQKWKYVDDSKIFDIKIKELAAAVDDAEGLQLTPSEQIRRLGDMGRDTGIPSRFETDSQKYLKQLQLSALDQLQPPQQPRPGPGPQLQTTGPGMHPSQIQQYYQQQGIYGPGATISHGYSPVQQRILMQPSSLVRQGFSRPFYGQQSQYPGSPQRSYLPMQSQFYQQQYQGQMMGSTFPVGSPQQQAWMMGLSQQQQQQWQQQYQMSQQMQRMGQTFHGQMTDYKITVEDTEEIKERKRQYDEIFEKFKSKGPVVCKWINQKRDTELHQMREQERLQIQIVTTKKTTEEFQDDMDQGLLEQIYKQEPDLVDMKPLLDIEKDEKEAQISLQLKEILIGKARSDKTFFKDVAGIQGILDRVQKIRDLKIDLEKEMDFDMASCKIQITFTSIKPTAMAVYPNQTLNKFASDNYDECFVFPQRFYFTMQFFDYGEEQTDVVTYQDRSEKDEKNADLLRTRGKMKHPLYLEHGANPTNHKTVTRAQAQASQVTTEYIFPNPNKNEKQLKSPESRYFYYKNFIDYLYQRTLTVDIWDQDSQMLFGCVRIALYDLLRQGNNERQIEKTVQILDLSRNVVKGEMEIRLKNVAHNVSSFVLENNIYAANPIIRFPKEYELKKKVVVPKVAKVPDNFSNHMISDNDYVQKIGLNALDRKRQRIKRFKLKRDHNYEEHRRHEQFDKMTFGKNKDQDQELKKLQRYKKQINKERHLQALINKMMMKETVVTTHYGKTEIIAFEFKNKLKRDGIFGVKINDPDSKFTKTPELTLIRDPKEWRYCCKMFNYPQPAEFDSITKSNVFVLDKGQTFVLLFKYRSLRKYKNIQIGKIKKSDTQVDRQFVTRKEQEDYKMAYETGIFEVYNRDREIRVIFHEKGKQIICGLKVMVQVTPTFYDHSFKQFEQELTLCQINLPTMYLQTEKKDQQGHLKKPIFQVSDKKCIIKWKRTEESTPGSNEPYIFLKTLDAGFVLTFMVLVYEDHYKIKLAQTWKFEVYSLTAIDTFVELGQESVIHLNLFSDKVRPAKCNCQCYIDRPRLASLSVEFDSGISLKAGQTNTVDIKVRSLRLEPQKFIINCVDYDTHKRLGVWCVRVLTSSPIIDRVIKVDPVLVNTQHRFSFSYHNHLQVRTKFQFFSSHTHYLTVEEDLVDLDCHEKKDIQCVIKESSRMVDKEICIFVKDEDEKIFETYLVRIQYTF